jgi:hypothetical protein
MNVRTTGIRSLLLTLLVLSIGQPSMAQDETPDTTYTSDDGFVTLIVPEGAIPDDTDVTITYQSSEEAPDELIDLAGAGAPSHYLVEPTDVTFDPPARLIRDVPIDTELYSASGPKVLGMLAVRDAAGAWSWAEDLGFRIDGPAESLELSGDIAHGGQVFALGTGLITSAVAAADGSVGYGLDAETWFNVPDFLGVPFTDEGHGASIADVAPIVEDTAIATVGEGQVSEAEDELLVRVPFECARPGTTGTGLTFTLDGVGDDVNVALWLELPETSVAVGILGSLECF